RRRELAHGVVRLEEDSVDARREERRRLQRVLALERGIDRHEVRSVTVFQWGKRADDERRRGGDVRGLARQGNGPPRQELRLIAQTRLRERAAVRSERVRRQDVGARGGIRRADVEYDARSVEQRGRAPQRQGSGRVAAFELRT